MKAIKRFIYSIWYGVKLEKGYRYQRIKQRYLPVLEQHHKLMLAAGWERYTDVRGVYDLYYAWYRKKK